MTPKGVEHRTVRSGMSRTSLSDIPVMPKGVERERVAYGDGGVVSPDTFCEYWKWRDVYGPRGHDAERRLSL